MASFTPYVPTQAATQSPAFSRDLLKSQLSWYLGAQNLSRPDMFLLSHVRGGPEMWVPVTLLASFPKVASMRADMNTVLSCLRELPLVELSGDGVYVRPRNHALLTSDHTLLVVGPQAAHELHEVLAASDVRSKVSIVPEHGAFLIQCGNPQTLQMVKDLLLSSKFNQVKQIEIIRFLSRSVPEQTPTQMPVMEQPSTPVFSYTPTQAPPQVFMYPQTMQSPYTYMQMSPTFPQMYPMYMPTDQMMMSMRPQYSAVDTMRHRSDSHRRGSADGRRRDSRSHSRDNSKPRNSRGREPMRHNQQQQHHRPPRSRRPGSESALHSQSPDVAIPATSNGPDSQSQSQQQQVKPAETHQQISHQEMQTIVSGAKPPADALSRQEHRPVVNEAAVDALSQELNDMSVRTQSYSAPVSPLDSRSSQTVFDHIPKQEENNVVPPTKQAQQVSPTNIQDNGQGKKTWASITKGQDKPNDGGIAEDPAAPQQHDNKSKQEGSNGLHEKQDECSESK
eukprot:m.92043 g.92043  ORF g.92043 m.92043 type:complete len:506 (+) comp14653_c0_seq5:437-1954(+)